MKYLIRRKGKKQSAHYWDGADTFCKMWSSGGMRQSKPYDIHDTPNGKEICQMCVNNAAKKKTPI